MPTPPLSQATRSEVIRLKQEGCSHREIHERIGVSLGAISNITRLGAVAQVSDKKVGEFDLHEWLDWMESGQALRKKASFSQHDGVIKLEGKGPQILCPQGDWHVASWGTDHRLVRNAIAEIKGTPNAWFPLMGDMIQMSIKLRSVLEVSDNLIPPDMQAAFLEQLIEEIVDRVPFSVWCNHGVEREEKQSGISMVKHILSSRSVYYNGIGHPDIQVGKEIYPAAVSHKFRGDSMYDTTHAMKRYARMEANDRELLIGADNHRAGFTWYFEGGKPRVALRTATFQTGSGYAQRYFSLKTWPVMPCVVLHDDEHRMVPFENLAQALKYIGQ